MHHTHASCQDQLNSFEVQTVFVWFVFSCFLIFIVISHTVSGSQSAFLTGPLFIFLHRAGCWDIEHIIIKLTFLYYISIKFFHISKMMHKEIDYCYIDYFTWQTILINIQIFSLSFFCLLCRAAVLVYTKLF